MLARWIAACRARLSALFGRRRFEADLDEELQFHLDEAAARNVRRGLSWEDARRAAARQLGDVALTKEAVRDESGARAFQDLGRDLWHALRHLRRMPAFAVTAIATIAVCVATSTAVFSVVSAVLWAPLPYPEAGRLVRLYNSYPNVGFLRTGTSVPEWFDRRERATTLTDLALYRQESNTITTAEGGRHAFALRVTPSFFTLLGATPALGRLFDDVAADTAGPPPLVVGHDLWQSAFGGRPDAINSIVVMDGTRYALIGVLPAHFRWPTWDAQVFTALRFGARDREVQARNTDEFEMLARLAPGATVEAATQEVNAINAAVLETYPADRARLIRGTGYTTVVRPYLDDLVRDVRQPMALLWMAALLVLAIGATNVTALFLLRAHARLREVHLRLALGASRFRILRQWLVESGLVAAAGGAVGLAGAVAALRLLGAFEVYEIPRVRDVSIGGPVWLWTVAVVVIVGALAGSLPAWSAVRRRGDLTREPSRTTTARPTWPQRALVTSQIAFALTLAITAGLLVASLRNLNAVQPGFTAEGVSLAALILPGERYPTGAARVDATARLLAAIEAVPGVDRAAIASQLPFSGGDGRTGLAPEGASQPVGRSMAVPFHTIVSAGYFETMAIRLRAGRVFTDADRLGGPRVAIIDRALEQRYWPDGALNRRFWFGATQGPAKEAVTIVGVVDSVLQNSLRERESAGAIYSFSAQNPPGFFRLAVRFDGPAEWPKVREQIAAVDRALVPFWRESLSDSVNASLLFQRGPMQLVGAFSVVGLFLGALGVYGVLAHEFGARRREIAVRLAIGGSHRGILALLWRRWSVLVVPGIAAGVAGALATSRLVESLLFETGLTDPMVIVAAVGVLVVSAAVAAVAPARRALAVDPALTLRQE